VEPVVCKEEGVLGVQKRVGEQDAQLIEHLDVPTLLEESPH
jgi:hypothetical protein